MSTPTGSALAARSCSGRCDGCTSKRRALDLDELDVHHLTPVAIARAEMLAAVDEIMETFRARG